MKREIAILYMSLKNIKFYFTMILILLSVVSVDAIAQDKVDFVTYGALANPSEGDDDFTQIFFIKADTQNSNVISIELFDADCFGENDVPFNGAFNSSFKYSLFGGDKAFSANSIKSLSPSKKDILSGNLIKEISLSDEMEYDNKWKIFAKVEKSKGELINGSYYFNLVVSGLNGDDANVYNIRAVGEKGDKVDIINYVPTIHLLPKSDVVQLRFNSNQNNKLIIKNYDADGAGVFFTSPYRSSIKLKSSGDGEWVSSTIELKPFEMNEICAIDFGPGKKKVNDAIFSVQNSLGTPIPILLPIETKFQSKRPVIKKDVSYSDKCNSVFVDGSKSLDSKDKDISAKWVLPDGKIKTGIKEELSFPNPGKYQITLAIKENSRAVESGSYEKFTVVINNPPNAVAGEDKFRIPNEKIFFYGSKSTDRDGKIVSYNWDFGDGTSMNGKTSSHIYSNPGIYKVKLRVVDNSSSPCNSSVDSINVWINASPIANAGKDIHCSVDELITLDGSESYDSDGHITSYQWFLGNGEKESGKKVFYSYKRAGKYKVSLKVTDDSNLGNNFGTDNIFVWVNKRPKANAGKNLEIAVGENVTLDASNSSDPDGEISEYLWSSPNLFEEANKVVTESFSTPGKYKVKLKVKDNSGTKSEFDEDEITIIVNAPPVANAGKDVYQTNPKVNFSGEKSSDSDGKITNFSWDFGDGTHSSKMNPTHIYSNPGIYQVKLSITDNSPAKNNSDSDEITVKINQKPIADAGKNLIVAPNESFELSSENSIDADGKIILTEWTLGKKKISSKSKFTYSIERSGTYNIKLKVADDSKHPEAIDFDNISVKVNEAPHIVSSQFYSIAKGDKVNFDASKSFDNDGKVVYYEYSINNKVVSNLPKFIYKFDNSGDEIVKLIITDDSKVANSQAILDIPVHVNNAPVIGNLDDILQCNNSVQFLANEAFDSDGDLLKYRWDFGDGDSENGKSIIHRYSSPGVFPVTLTVDDGQNLSNSTTTAQLRVKINSAPIANVGIDEVTCTGDLVTFDASKSYDADGDLLKYEWDFGDGTSDEGITVSRSFVDPGLYQIKLKVTDNSGLKCNYSYATKLLKVVESPVAFAGEDIVGCANNPIEFDAYKSTDSDGIVNSFAWDFGDGSSGGGAKTSHIYDKPGIYNVVLTITGEQTGDCDNMDTDELLVTVEAAPLADFSSVDSIALNKNIEFNASKSDGNGSNIITYDWDFGDGVKAKGEKVNHKFTKSGSYFVKLSIVTDSKAECKSATLLKSVYVNDSPIAAAGEDKNGLTNDIFHFDASLSHDANGRIKKYLWNFGDGTSSEGINVFHSYKRHGLYKVELKVFDNTNLDNNSSTDELLVKVNEIPTGTISMQSFGFVGDNISIKPSNLNDVDGKVVNINWHINNYSDSSLSGLEYIFTKSGVYNVVATIVDNDGGENQISKTIIIYPIPELAVKSKNVVCINKSIKLSNENSLDNLPIELDVEWNFPNGKKYFGKSISTRFIKSGINECTALIRNPLNKDRILVKQKFNVFVNQSPVAVISDLKNSYIGGANDEVLFNASKSFDLDGDALTFEWNFGDGSSGNGEKVFHKYLKAGTYKVTLLVSDNRNCDCNSNKIEKYIKISKRK